MLTVLPGVGAFEVVRLADKLKISYLSALQLITNTARQSGTTCAQAYEVLRKQHGIKPVKRNGGSRNEQTEERQT